MYWKQRSKCRWDELGDHSTKFFFKSVKCRSVRNEIRGIKGPDGSWLSQPRDVNAAFREHFMGILQGQGTGEKIDGSWLDLLPRISDHQSSILSAPFTNEEIRAAAFAPKPLKSPGHDGVPPVFIQKLWSEIRSDVYEGVHSFFSSGYLLQEANKTFITLIPKEDRPDEVSKFRPISLCNSSYKIISKCLVNRLKVVLPDLVEDYQNAFIPGRLMVDNCFIASELMAYVRRKTKGKQCAGILKVDLSKAYDRVRWDFLEDVLKAMAFPAVWIQRIMQCVSTVSYSVLVNGEATEPFSPTVGLRQGDPLSPYLFILCMEVLSRRLSWLQLRRQLPPLRVARLAPPISHLFFADDALFCFKASEKTCKVLRKCIDRFCSISGEIINFAKSYVVFSPNTPVNVVESLKRPLGVEAKSKLGIYLGCPMDVDGRSTAQLADLHSKVSGTIASWKFSHLSQAGKVVLINGILTALSANVLSLYAIPKYILDKVTASIMKFWWSSSGDKTPIYWRKKEVLFMHKNDGGLGI